MAVGNGGRLLEPTCACYMHTCVPTFTTLYETLLCYSVGLYDT
jgi:hypothetical protein